MATKLDKIIVVDVEATCWKHGTPPGKMNEIIEIGVCLLDVQTRQRKDKESILVKSIESTVGDYCTEITGLTQRDVEKGLHLKDACLILQRKYMSFKRVWASYGDFDRNIFQRQCQRHSVKYPFGPTHINVKALFALKNKLEKEVGFGDAMELMGMPFEGKPHRGVDDAWNIALLLAHLL